MFFKISKLNNMKTIKYMLSAVAVLAVLASCDRKESFQHEKFVSFGNGSYTVDEDAGVVAVPVHVYNAGSEEVTVTVKATDGTAKTGTNYEIIEPASGVLNFAPGETEKNVQILVKNLRDKFTGNLSFSLSLASVTDGIATGGFNSINFTINDKDHPLAKFFGTWTGTILSEKSGKLPMNVTIEAVEGDNTYSKLLVKDLEPFAATQMGLTSAQGKNTYTAVVDESKTVMTISARQKVGYDYQGAYPIFIAGTNKGDITLTLSDSKTLAVSPFGLYAEINGNFGYFEQYAEGCTLTKK